MLRSFTLSARARTEAFFGHVQGHGKSPCFSRTCVLRVSDVGCLCLDTDVLNMRFCLKRA